MPLTEDSSIDYKVKASQNSELIQLEPLTKSKTLDFFEDLYSYPPKFTVKWSSLDEFKDDLFLKHNYGVLEHSIPFIDYIEDWFFTGSSNNEALAENYSTQEYLQGFLNKVNTSNFYTSKTKEIQTTLSTVPVFVILNGHGEVILSKPAAIVGSNNIRTILNKVVYNYCGAFDSNIESRNKLGFFFLSPSDADVYLEEIAKTDIEGTKTLGLSIHCIGLDAAYRITREHHPETDFRFVPNFTEVKDLLIKSIGTSDSIVEDEQQQLRFRRRTVNLFPYLEKLGKAFSISNSFLHRNEYFKGVPIYVVQVSDKSRNLLAESYYTTIGILDNIYGRFIQSVDYPMGFGHNWIMQGSIQENEDQKTKNLTNYIFFEEKQALNFIKKQGRKINRYKGSRTSNIAFMVRKPKIYIYNLEDFLEGWEQNIQDRLEQASVQSEDTIFNAKASYFIPQKETADKVFNIKENNNVTFVKSVKQTLNVKVKVLKQFVGMFFSV